MALRCRAWGRCRGTDDVVVRTEEAIDPGVLLRAALVEEVVDRAVEAGVAVLGAAAEGIGGVVEARVGVDQGAVGDVGDVGVE